MGVASDVIRRRLDACSFPYKRELNEMEVLAQTAACARALAQNDWRTVAEYNGSESEVAEIRDWIRRKVQEDQDVAVVWLSYGFGVISELSDILALLDDVWQPGSDDIWIQGITEAVVLDHEEQVRVYASLPA